MAVFEIFWLFMYHCVVKSSVCIVYFTTTHCVNCFAFLASRGNVVQSTLAMCDHLVPSNNRNNFQFGLFYHIDLQKKIIKIPQSAKGKQNKKHAFCLSTIVHIRYRILLLSKLKPMFNLLGVQFWKSQRQWKTTFGVKMI